MVNDLTWVLCNDILNELLRFAHFNITLFNDMTEALLIVDIKTVLQQNKP